MKEFMSGVMERGFELERIGVFAPGEKCNDNVTTL